MLIDPMPQKPPKISIYVKKQRGDRERERSYC